MDRQEESIVSILHEGEKISIELQRLLSLERISISRASWMFTGHWMLNMFLNQ